MQIANPIYDVVFKYLMQDNKVAKLILSTIINEEIETLDFRPQETAITIDRESSVDFTLEYLSVIRMDFSAKIKNSDGSYKLVIIELQKAKLPADIMRFRKYLGEQYANGSNVAEKEVAYKKALPIISIYFLGHTLNHTDAPIIKVNRNYIDIATGEKIEKKEEFIESLTHDSYIIQIPYLKEKRRNDLEILLSVFDQSLRLDTEKKRHLLDIDDLTYPEKYRDVIRRLVAAFNEPDVRKKMEQENELYDEFAFLDKELAKKKKELSEHKKELGEHKEEILKKEAELTEKDAVLKQRDIALLEKEKELAEMRKLIEELQKNK